MSPLEFQKPDHAPSGGPRSHSALQSFFLNRLERLLRTRRDLGASLAPDDWRARLLRRSIYATYCECLELGMAEEARKIVGPASNN